MAKKFRGAEIVQEIEKAMDKGLGRFLINTQSKLSASSPIDTGRLAGSWMIGKGVPDREVAPEMEKGSEPTITPYSGEITLDVDWFISNSLPYAERAAYDPGYVGRRGGVLATGSAGSRNNLTGRSTGVRLFPEESEMSFQQIRAHIESRVYAAFQVLVPPVEVIFDNTAETPPALPYAVCLISYVNTTEPVVCRPNQQ